MNIFYVHTNKTDFDIPNLKLQICQFNCNKI